MLDILFEETVGPMIPEAAYIVMLREAGQRLHRAEDARIEAERSERERSMQYWNDGQQDDDGDYAKFMERAWYITNRMQARENFARNELARIKELRSAVEYRFVECNIEDIPF